MRIITPTLTVLLQTKSSYRIGCVFRGIFTNEDSEEGVCAHTFREISKKEGNFEKVRGGECAHICEISKKEGWRSMKN